MKFFFPDTVIDKAASARMGKMLARKEYPFVKTRKSKEYYCHLLTAEQLEYSTQYKDTSTYMDLNFDKFVAKEILIAGDSAKIADICKAREFLDQTDGKMEEAQKLYNKYIKESRDLSFANDEMLPF